MIFCETPTETEQDLGLPYRESPKFPMHGTLAQRRRKARDNNIAMALLQTGATLRTVAEVFGVSVATVHHIKMRYFGSHRELQCHHADAILSSP